MSSITYGSGQEFFHHEWIWLLSSEFSDIYTLIVVYLIFLLYAQVPRGYKDTHTSEIYLDIIACGKKGFPVKNMGTGSTVKSLIKRIL